jgi:hypothetical protein
MRIQRQAFTIDTPFTKENLDAYLKEFGKEFRKLNGTKIPAEIILIGGAAILANYGFRDVTYDIDAVILASSAMKEAANSVGDRLGLPNGWLNMDSIDKAIAALYGDTAALPAISQKTINDAFTDGDYERVYREIRENEKQAKGMLVDFDKAYPGELKSENIDTVLEQARRKRRRDDRER